MGSVKVNVFVLYIILIVTVIQIGLAQRFNNAYQHPYQSIWVDPYRQYQFLPSLPSSGGASLIGGGRVVEAVKAHPIHYSTMIGGAPQYSGPSSFLSTSASQPPSKYFPGYYYGDKPGHFRSPPSYTVSSTMYSPPFYDGDMPTASITTVASPSPPTSMHSFRRPPAPTYHQYQAPSRFPPGPVTSASMDTYREALDLFSEVVRKLEKETVPGFGSYSSLRFPHSASFPNGIYGSSAHFPHHLDHIMGPDFLQRAHKLYNKIIKEQNHNRGRPHPPAHFASSASRGPSHGNRNRLSYFESSIRSGNKRRPADSYSYTSSSPYARLDKEVLDSPLEKSLIDAVKALEMNIDKHNGGSQAPIVDVMDTSESRMAPQIIYPSQASNDFPPQKENNYLPPNNNNYQVPSSINNYYSNHMLVSPSTTAIPPSTPPATQSSSEEDDFSISPSPSSERVIPPPQPSIIPLNENDFVEHPLPYNEYEELIREIATNHNYK